MRMDKKDYKAYLKEVDTISANLISEGIKYAGKYNTNSVMLDIDGWQAHEAVNKHSWTKNDDGMYCILLDDVLDKCRYLIRIIEIKQVNYINTLEAL